MRAINRNGLPVAGRGVRSLLRLSLAWACLLQPVFGLPATQGVAQEYPYTRPLSREEFEPVSLPGIGDRQNTWVWSMKWYKGKLYVGTNRAWHCVEVAGYARVPLINLLFRYPPSDPDLECTPDPLDLPLQAEIWTWSPEENLWERVYQAPLVEIPGHPGRMTGRDVGYRDMVIFREADGTEALYVMGVTQNSIFPGFPPPRILRTTDGRNFEAVPQDPGTFLGDLNQDNFHSSFRAPSVYKGRLFLETGTVQGNGELIESEDPSRGNDAFRMVLPPETRVYITTVFNGYLYIGIQDTEKGFQIVKTLAEGEPPYELIPVVENGGFAEFVPLRTSATVLYSYVHDGMLFAGTDKPAELLRIRPDDTWDLVVGKPRMSLDGYKYPISGYGQGFNSTTNHHIWRMAAYQGWLYMGTADASTTNFKESFLGPALEPYMGFDLFATKEGYYMYEISRNGFDNKFNLGIRGFVPTEYGLYFGAANNWYGAEVWWGRHRGTEEASAGGSAARYGAASAMGPGSFGALEATGPDRLEVETLESTAILSWDAPPVGFSAEIYRRQLESPGSAFRRVGSTKESFWIVDLPPPGTTELYRVRLRAPGKGLSLPSNTVVLPNACPPLTCNELMARVSGEPLGDAPPDAPLAEEIEQTLEAIAAHRVLDGTLEGLIDELALALQDLEAKPAPAAPAAELEVLLRKFLRRCRLAESGLLPVSALFESGTTSAFRAVAE